MTARKKAIRELLDTLPASRPALSFRDLAAEASEGILRRPWRSVLTSLGTVLGVAAAVGTLGFVWTASAQVSSKFNAVRATEITVRAADGATLGTDASERIRRLLGVQGVGEVWSYSLGTGVDVLPPVFPDSPATAILPIVAASAEGLNVLGCTVRLGKLYGPVHEDLRMPVVVLGPEAAATLGITQVQDEPAVFIGDRALSVIGIIAGCARHPEMAGSVFISPGAAQRYLPPSPGSSPALLVTTRVGASSVVGQEVPYALNPVDPSSVNVTVPIDPKELRLAVQGDLRSLGLLLAALSLGIGAAGIANSTLVSVLERTAEIGLRRAVGALPRHIALQVLFEGAILGLLSGMVGASVGGLSVVTVAALRHWTAVLDTRLLIAGPLIGVATGLLAGIQPSVRAIRIQPLEALRG